MKFEKIKRNLSLLVAFCMVVSLLQVPVMAEEAPESDAGPLPTVSAEAGELTEDPSLLEEVQADEEAGELAEDSDLLELAPADEEAMASLPDEAPEEDPDDGLLPSAYQEMEDEENSIQLLSLDGAAGDEVIASGTYGTNITWELTADGVLTLNGTGRMSGEIPWEGYIESIKSIVFRGDITSVGAFAFTGCSSLISVELSDAITYIEMFAFEGCSSLTFAKLPAGELVIGSSAFKGCSSLALTELSDGVTMIEDGAFKNCSSLALTELPDGITSIGQFAFENCTSLALTELPPGLTSIEKGAFDCCTSLALTELPAGVISIGERAFWGCTSLALTELPAGVTSIKQNAFHGCTSLTFSELPAGVTYIGDSAFSGCTSLALTKLPAGLTSIEKGAFDRCTSLALTELPDGITSIGQSAFSNCTSLALTKLPAGLTSIGNSAFIYCDSLTLTELPDGITSIGQSAFSNCTSLALTKLPAGLTSIGDQAFFRCHSLALTELPAGVTSIGKGAFWYCTWPISTQHYILEADGNYTLAKTTVQRIESKDTLSKVLAPVETFEHYHTVSHENELLSIRMPEYIRYGESITLRRYYDLDTNTVTFNLGEGDNIITQSVPYGGKATEPKMAEKPGYTATWVNMDGEHFNFNTPVTSNLILTLNWTAKGDTPYQVKHYLQNLTGDDYNLQDTDKLTAATDSTVDAIAKVYAGFHVAVDHPDRVASGIVTADGALVMSIYYDRDLFSVTLDTGDGSDPVTQEIPYGGTVTEPEAPSKPGYDFDGWQDQNGNKFDFDTPVTSELTLTPIWTAKPTSSTSSSSGRAPAQSPKLEEDLFDLEVPLAGIVFDDVLPGDAYYDDVMGAYNAGYMDGITPNLFCPDAYLTRAQAADTFAKVAAAKLTELEITGDFADVNGTITYAEAITWANSAGVEIGYGNGYFGPTDYITREQLALMLYRTYGNGAKILTWEDNFSDLDAVSDWAEAAVRWAVHVDLLEGTDAGKLLPQGTVTRAEAAALIMRVADLTKRWEIDHV